MSKDTDDTIETYPEEKKEIENRRGVLYEQSSTNAHDTAKLWGLALSGGGIRSATFCLGFLQSLAKASHHQKDDLDDSKNHAIPLLARFDYLSTVSGGGYVGGFLSGLFRRASVGNNNANAGAKANADETFKVLKCDPPGRMGQHNSETDRPLRWLRDNGRYLAPNNSGDLFFDIAITLRNLCAVHYVIGVSLVAVFFLMYMFRLSTAKIFESAMALEKFMQPACSAAKSVCNESNLTIWWSPWFAIAGLFVLLGLIPFGVAYWLNQEKSGSNSPMWSAATLAALAVLLILSALTIFVAWSPTFGIENDITPISLLTIGTIAIILLIALTYVLGRGAQSVVKFRAQITRDLSSALWISLILLGFATLETLGQSLYLWLSVNQSDPLTVGGIGAAIVAAVTALRHLPKVADTEPSGILKKLPFDAVIGVVGVLLFMMLLLAWQVITTGVVFQWRAPSPVIPSSIIWLHTLAPSFTYLALVGMVLLALTVASGYFLGFVNLSTLQPLYGARLRRAYLGASNAARFDANGKSKVTEAHDKDDFTLSEYFSATAKHAGPAHIINVTINATTGSGDALTQRDRKGIPMTISADGFNADGFHYGDVPPPAPAKSAPAVPTKSAPAELSIGSWIGISGAAVSTGMGQNTALGASIALMFANARLGWWWFAGKSVKGKRSASSLTSIFRNQTYLLRETYAKFNGTDGTHWYLSDGGHFENTGVYELLRRKVPVIVCCDCGADPEYKFGDLANLMRLSRIDFRAEFEPLAGNDPRLGNLFGQNIGACVASNAEEIRAAQAQDPTAIVPKPRAKFVLAYCVTFKDEDGNVLNGCSSILLVVKPAVLDQSPHDVSEYKGAHPTFPQESTADQFFDDAQWESYRRLGVELGGKLFS